MNLTIERLKRIKVLVELNSVLKCKILCFRLFYLDYKFGFFSKLRSIHYSPEKAIESFKFNHGILNKKLEKKKIGELRVLWIGSNKSQDESGFLQNLKKLAIVTEFYNEGDEYGLCYGNFGNTKKDFFSTINSNDECLIKQIKGCLNNGGLDLVFGQMWANYISINSLNFARSFGIPVINISMDDRLPEHWSSKFGTKLGSIGLKSATDLVLTTSPETCAWYLVEKTPALYFPLASSIDLFKDLSRDYKKIDVLFIGNRYGVREKIINFLLKNGINVEAFGLGWPNGPVDSKKIADLSVNSKIILGIGTIGHCEKMYTLKLRDFDSPMSGSFYITHRNYDLLQFFDEGVDIECYENQNELLEKIKFYLNNEELRMKIANNGCSKAILHHDWYVRLYSLFSRLGLLE